VSRLPESGENIPNFTATSVDRQQTVTRFDQPALGKSGIQFENHWDRLGR
jgi:hypothetical protein